MGTKDPPYNPNMPGAYDPPPPYTENPSTPLLAGFTTTTTGSTTYVHPQPPAGNYGAVPILVQPVSSQNVVIVGGCPACRVGVLNEQFTIPGLCCAILFFPWGLLCCLLTRERRCSNCGAVFD